MIEKESIPIQIFWHHINNSFGTNFPQKLVSTLSNMLAIDFALNMDGHLNFSPSDKAMICVKNITAYLKSSDQRFDESFKSATLLFSAALTPPRDNNYIESVNDIKITKKADDSSSMHLIETLINSLVNEGVSEKHHHRKVEINKRINLGPRL